MITLEKEFIIILLLLITSYSYAGLSETQKSKLKHECYTPVESFKSVVHYSDEQLHSLLRLVEDNKKKEEYKRGYVHNGKSRFEILVISKKRSGSQQMDQTYLFFDENYKRVDLKREHQQLITQIVDCFCNISQSENSYIRFTFYVDPEEDRDALHWHQDVWEKQPESPDILLFWVLNRDVSQCPRCLASSYDDQHPEVRLALGTIDEDKLYFFIEREGAVKPTFFPDTIKNGFDSNILPAVLGINIYVGDKTLSNT